MGKVCFDLKVFINYFVLDISKLLGDKTNKPSKKINNHTPKKEEKMHVKVGQLYKESRQKEQNTKVKNFQLTFF